MTDEQRSTPDASRPLIYQFKVRGHLGRQWINWFEGLDITWEDGNTLLTGPVIDQAALHGILKKVRDLGLPLLAVSSVGPGTQEDKQVSYE